MQEPDAYRYDVFVSYRHRPDDECWANWLQEALETFETPAPLVQKGFAGRLGRVFVDDTEMAAGPELSRPIKEALWQSRWLIVVCSPDTPQSDWVRQEITFFRNAWGRKDRVLALLIAGVPSLSYPPELRELRTVGSGPDTTTEVLEPAGANVAETQGKTEAELKALARDKFAATLLGCDLGELRDRQEERLRKVTTTRFFHTVIRRRGVLEGVGEVTPEAQRHRAQTYRFEERDGRVQRVDLINGHGILIHDEGAICRWDLAWRSDGTLEAVACRTRHGVVKTREQWSRDAATVDFFHDDDGAAPQAGMIGASGLAGSVVADLGKRRTTIVRHRITYDPAGFATRIRYARDAFNTPTADTLGSYGEWIVPDVNGLPTAKGFLDADGQPITLRNGVHQTLTEHDAAARLVLQRYRDSKEQPINGGDHWAAGKLAYDEWGNAREQEFEDELGKPTTRKDGVHRTIWEHDRHGNTIAEAYFGPNGKVVADKDGTASAKIIRDDRGRIVELAWFGSDANLTFHRDGYVLLKFSYDANDNVSEVTTLGKEGQPVLNRLGYVRKRRSYDIQGNLLEEVFLDESGFALDGAQGHARSVFEYDQRGNRVHQSNFTANGSPAIGKDGFASYRLHYDLKGNRIASEGYGSDGLPCLGRDGWHRMTVEFDAQGNAVELGQFDVDGNLIEDRTGVARYSFTYDERGNRVVILNYDRANLPCRNQYGVFRSVSVFDRRGNEKESRYFGPDNLPSKNSTGFARVLRRFDARGQTVEEAFFDVDDAPVCCTKGFARATQFYDHLGNQIEVNYWDVDGTPISSRDGIAKFTSTYDERGHRTGFTVFGVDGEVLWSGFEKHDAQGRLLERMNLGPDGTPQPHADGYCGWRQEWDAIGNRTGVVWIDAEGQPTPHKDGYAQARSTFDLRGNEGMYELFDEEGAPTLDRRGYARVRREFDHFGNRISGRSYGLSDEPVLTTDLYHETRTTWDRCCRRAARSYYGLDGEPVDRRGGYHRVDFLRDPWGTCTGKRFTDRTGTEVPAPEDDDELPDD